MTTPYQSQEGRQLCVVYFLRPASDGSKTLVRPAANLKPFGVPAVEGAFRFCFAEFDSTPEASVREDVPFEERWAQSEMFYCDASVKDVEKLAEDMKCRALAERFRAQGYDQCAKVKKASPEDKDATYFPFCDGDQFMHTIRTIKIGYVATLKANAKRPQPVGQN